MKKIICENEKKDRITFTYDFPFFLLEADGLYKKEANVSTSSSAFGIGENYEGTSIKKRNIIISGIIKDNFLERRSTLYQLFPHDSEGTLYYYENDVKRKINYIVEDVEIEEKGIPRTFTVSLICPYPYFTEIEETKISMASWSPAFCFPLEIQEDVGIELGTKNMTIMGTINNKTNIEFGLTITFIANGNVLNPYIINVETQEKMQLNKQMKSGDMIIVTTKRNNKDIIYIPDATGRVEEANYLMKYGSKFFQAYPGVNTLRAGADEDEQNLTTQVTGSIEYEAV